MRKAWLTLVIMWFCLPLCGCWSRQELNEVSIAVGLGIDRIGDGYRVAVQIVNPVELAFTKGHGTRLAPVVTIEQEGKTIPEALRRMTVVAPRKFQFSHLRIVVFGEKMARSGLKEVLDFLSRDSEMRNDFFLIVARNRSAADILKVNGVLDPISANHVYTKLKTSDELWAATSKITLNELLLNMTTMGRSAILTGIDILEQHNSGQTGTTLQQIVPSRILYFSGTAVFDKDRLIGWLEEDETKAVNYALDEVKHTVATIECPNPAKGIISLEVYNAKARTRVLVKEEKLEIHLDLIIEQDVTDIECNLNMHKTDVIFWINNEGSRKIRELIENTVDETKRKLGVDVFGFGIQVHRQHPKIWRSIKDWNLEFKTVPVYIHPQVLTRRIGTIQQPIPLQVQMNLQGPAS